MQGYRGPEAPCDEETKHKRRTESQAQESDRLLGSHFLSASLSPLTWRMVTVRRARINMLVLFIVLEDVYFIDILSIIDGGDRNKISCSKSPLKAENEIIN